MFSTYASAFDPGLLGRREEFPSKIPIRSIGRSTDETESVAPGIRIDWPQNESGRVRNIISRGGLRRRYRVSCFRGGDREAQGEAPEEEKLYVLLDACAGVEFQDQPATFTFEWNGVQEVHRPDALVVIDDAKEFLECKKDHEARSLYIRRRSERLSELLLPLGFGYRVVSTRMLSAGSYFENAVRMRRRAKFHLPHEVMERVRRLASGTPLSKASEVLGDISISCPLDLLHTLLYRGELSGNLSQPISLGMEVGPPRARGVLPWVWDLFEKIS